MLLREYRESDAEEIEAVYRNSILGIASGVYDRDQIRAWSSSFEDRLEPFRKLLSLDWTWVAVEVSDENSDIVAFGQLSPADRIAFLFTDRRFSRRGYATEVYQKLESISRDRGTQCLRTEASRISKYFFLKQGFRLLEPELVIRHGVLIERFKMLKSLSRE